jgi:uncharacterized membrane protein YfcA
VTILLFTLLIGVGSFAAGFLGALTGLGGGVVIVPLLLLCGVPLHYAQGASLVSVIATSSGAAASYVKEGYSNIRIGMFLEISTTLGALAGAFLIAVLMPQLIEIIFGCVLIFSAIQASRPRRAQAADAPQSSLASRLRLNGCFPTPEGPKYYHVYQVGMGFLLMFVAGVLSGLLGIGSGALKVLAMDQVMRIPFKVSTTTSNFMIGVTAAASAGIYLRQGYIEPALSMPVMLGVLAGSMVGARVLIVVRTSILRRVFGAVILALALQMMYDGVKGFLGGR